MSTRRPDGDQPRGRKPDTRSRETGNPGTRRPDSKKAARQRLAAEQARQAAADQRRQRLIRLGAAIAVVVLIVGIGVAWQLGRDQVEVDDLPQPTAISRVDAGVETSNGTPGLPVVDVYEDFQCPHCRDLEARVGTDLLRLAADGQANVIYHPVSFLGPESVRAANAVGCATEAGRFPEYHAKLFAEQPLEGTGGFSTDDLLGYGEEVGITGGGFERCVTGSALQTWVAAVQQEAGRRGVQGTPTLFVDGKQLPADQYTAAGIKAAVVAAR
jgi:protein-disulfide isomerase